MVRFHGEVATGRSTILASCRLVGRASERSRLTVARRTRRLVIDNTLAWMASNERTRGVNVLSVGNCGFDDSHLKSMCAGLGSVHFVRAMGQAEAARQLAEQSFDLVFLNRIFDGDQCSGVEWLGELVPSHPSTRFVLLSEQAAAQSRALELGAHASFGKSQVGVPGTLDLLRRMLASDAS